MICTNVLISESKQEPSHLHGSTGHQICGYVIHRDININQEFLFSGLLLRDIIIVREICIYESQVLPKGTIGDM